MVAGRASKTLSLSIQSINTLPANFIQFGSSFESANREALHTLLVCILDNFSVTSLRWPVTM